MLQRSRVAVMQGVCAKSLRMEQLVLSKQKDCSVCVCMHATCSACVVSRDRKNSPFLALSFILTGLLDVVR